MLAWVEIRLVLLGILNHLAVCWVFMNLERVCIQLLLFIFGILVLPIRSIRSLQVELIVLLTCFPLFLLTYTSFVLDLITLIQNALRLSYLLTCFRVHFYLRRLRCIVNMFAFITKHLWDYVCWISVLLGLNSGV